MLKLGLPVKFDNCSNRSFIFQQSLTQVILKSTISMRFAHFTWLNLSYPGGVVIIILCREIEFSFKIEPKLDIRPVCKFKFVHCGPVEKNQSALSFSVEAWRPEKVRDHLFPNSEIEIFDNFQRFSTKFPNFHKILRGLV